MNLPLSLQDDFHTLKNLLAARTRRAYFVGGCVRDHLMGRTSVDYDIEVYDLTPEAFASLMEELGAEGVGKAFFVYKWKAFDISLPRTETKTGRGHAAFDVALCNDERGASMRRDFTMNSLMQNLFTGEVLDHWGGGKDLANRTIRLIDEGKFKEDSLRVLRAVQFAARFGFRVEEGTLAVCRSIPLDDLSGERVFRELEKLFTGAFPHYGLFYLEATGAMERLFGLEPDRSRFFKAALELARNRKRFREALLPYYFLYVLGRVFHRSPERFLEGLPFPNRYGRALKRQKGIPRNPTPRFLTALSLQYPLQNWLGHYRKGVEETARAHRCFEGEFPTGVTPADLLEEGYSGKELGEELRRRKLAKIKETYE